MQRLSQGSEPVRSTQTRICGGIPPNKLQKEKCAYMIQPTELGFRIASKRRARGLTQGQVAIHMGVSPQAVSKWERGLACPDLVFLDDLADLLDVSIEELLLGRPSVALASA